MSIEQTVYKGRTQLFTDYLPNKMRTITSTSKELNESTIPQIIKDVWGQVQSNSVTTAHLFDYYKGQQDILDRVKIVRPDVNNKIVLNHAMAITRDVVGYTFGKPIRYAHRKDEAREAVAELNSLIEAEDKFSSDQELALFASICGTAYRGVFADAYGVEDDIPFSIVTLDPESTFVVYSTEIGHPPVLACTFYSSSPTLTSEGNKLTYLIYTHDATYRYEVIGGAFGVLSDEDLIEKVPNILGQIPIVEYPNNIFRIGDWEMAKGLLDAVNLVGSDSVNDIEQFVNSILVATNVELTEKSINDIRDNKVVSIRSDKDLPAELKYISEQLEQGASQQVREFLSSQLGIIVGIPSRDSRAGGGGDTGDAVFLRDGFQDLEIVARNKETCFKRAERVTLKLIINLLQKQKGSDKITGLKTRDVDIRFSRNMTEAMLVKANAIAILHGTKILDPVDVLTLVGITTDPDDMVTKGKDYWDAVAKEAQKLIDDQLKKEQKVKDNKPVTNINDPSLVQKVNRN